MREWTLEERYRVLQSADEIKGLHEALLGSVYRQKYHIQPITGLSSTTDSPYYYSIDGRRTTIPTCGLYIHNGQRIIIRK